MKRARADQPLRTSVLDRLIGASAGSRAPRLEEVKQAVRRDLELLLNSRCRCIPPPADLAELETSVVTFGIPDFTGADVSTDTQRQKFVRRIEATIRRFEPRFVEVRVQQVENADPHDRTLRLRIDAKMHADPAPEPLVIDSVMDPLSSTFRVNRGEHG